MPDERLAPRLRLFAEAVCRRRHVTSRQSSHPRPPTRLLARQAKKWHGTARRGATHNRSTV